MSAAVYEALAYAMRYWFILVMLVILLAVIIISMKELRHRRAVLGMVDEWVGYLEVLSGEARGERFGLKADNTIGSSPNADVCVYGQDVKKAHAHIYQKAGDLVIAPLHKSHTTINGRLAVRPHLLKTGDVVSLGGVELRVYIKRERLDHDY